MKQPSTLLTAFLLGAGLLLALTPESPAQTSEALMDALVRKGILTEQEAEDIKADVAKENRQYNKITIAGKTVSSFNIYGDFRGRYEGFFYDNATGSDRHRYRYRLRAGFTASLVDHFDVGLRLTSSEPASGGSNGGDPISGNATFQDNASKKFIYLDLAYSKWTPINNPDWQTSLTVGKMENPFVFSDMVFDGDYTPEGAALQLTHNFSERHAAKFSAGGFLIDEIGADSNDPYWVGAQLRFDSLWNPKLQTSFGVGALNVANSGVLNASRSSSVSVTGTGLGTNTTTTWSIPNQNGGNLRSSVTGVSGTAGTLANHYNPVVADAAVTYTLDRFWLYNGPFPIRFAGDFIHNPAADDENTGYSVGITLGKSGKRGLWDLSYRYKHLEGDAWFEEFVDSDFGAFYEANPPAGTSTRSGGATGYGAGTNVKGHIVKASYSAFDSLTLGVTAFITELIEEFPSGSKSGAVRLQADAIWKF